MVGKKSLMRTLQTLGSVPEWKNDDHQQSSDSEAEVPSHSQKRKNRRKKRKKAEMTAEQQEKGDVDQTVNEEKHLTKKRKKDNKFGELLTASKLTFHFIYISEC